ncbi:hypothetical protein ALC56_00374 [Trachymyrmex septentrionalis]|uniref:Uncharacterized protein n=1 Tax=Trachymyrmex septentrionalis TaxID=34720 RepID=A0A195FZ95_9HYME|nr:hypothetical protein ALC56_00374 [Trachymyrmex septentrionalis]
MTQVSSCGAAQCAIIKGVLFCLMDLSKFQYLENEYLEGSRALVEPQSAATSRVGNLSILDILLSAKIADPTKSNRNHSRGKEKRCHRKDESRSEIIPAPDVVGPDKMDDVREKNFIDNTLFSELRTDRRAKQIYCSMNAGSNTKVTKSKSVHYAFSATNRALFLSDYLKSNEGEYPEICSAIDAAHSSVPSCSPSPYQYQPVITLAREHNEIVAERVEGGMSVRSRWPAAEGKHDDIQTFNTRGPERVRCWLRGPKISNPLGIRKLMKHST